MGFLSPRRSNKVDPETRRPAANLLRIPSLIRPTPEVQAAIDEACAVEVGRGTIGRIKVHQTTLTTNTAIVGMASFNQTAMIAARMNPLNVEGAQFLANVGLTTLGMIVQEQAQ